MLAARRPCNNAFGTHTKTDRELLAEITTKAWREKSAPEAHTRTRAARAHTHTRRALTHAHAARAEHALSAAYLHSLFFLRKGARVVCALRGVQIGGAAREALPWRAEAFRSARRVRARAADRRRHERAAVGLRERAVPGEQC